MNFGTKQPDLEAGLHELFDVLRNIVLEATDTAYALDGSVAILGVDTTIGPVAVTLPDATQVRAQHFTVKKTSGDVNAITVAAPAAQTIDGAASLVFSTAQRAYTIASDGVNYQIVSKYDGVAS
jgi:hypothetical protein